MSEDWHYTLQSGPFDFQFSANFFIYLLIGMVVVVFHAQEDFDKPTYEASNDEPASLMVPRFISSFASYVRGYSIYVISMVLFYLTISVIGPTLSPLLNINGKNATTMIETAAPPAEPGQPIVGSNRTKNIPKDEWPLAIALSIIGLAPRFPGLREPELILRRFSHRVAAIPAYFTDIVYRLEMATFDERKLNHSLYAKVGVTYKPAQERPEGIDVTWAKLCGCFYLLRELASGAKIFPTEQPISQKTRDALLHEIHIFLGKLQALDKKILAHQNDLNNADITNESTKLLRSLYMLIACSVISFRLRDRMEGFKWFGFVFDGENPDFGRFTAVTLFGTGFALFLVSELIQSVISWYGIKTSLISPDFGWRCYDVFAKMLPLGVVAYLAMRDAEEASRKKTTGVGYGVIPVYLTVGIKAMATSFIVIFFENVMTHAFNWEAVRQLAVLAFLYTIAPSAAAILIFARLQVDGSRGTPAARVLASGAVMAVCASLSTYLVLSQQFGSLAPDQKAAMSLGSESIKYGVEVLQYLVAGLGVGVLGEIFSQSLSSQKGRSAAGLPPTAAANFTI